MPVELEPGEDEPKPDADGESEPDAAEAPSAELPPAAETPLPDVDPPLDGPPPGQDDDGEEEGENDDDEEKVRSGGGPAGTASESTKTSPRMCSTFCDGTPDWSTGCVNTTCSPVAVTVSSPAFDAPVLKKPVLPLESVVLVSVVVLDWSLPALVVPVGEPAPTHELDPVEKPDVSPQELVVDVSDDVVVVVVDEPGDGVGGSGDVVVDDVVVVPEPVLVPVPLWSHEVIPD